jgi:predicted transglutaminase-like cysteine proteinase
MAKRVLAKCKREGARRTRTFRAEWLIILGALVSSTPSCDAGTLAVSTPVQAAFVTAPRIDSFFGIAIQSRQPATTSEKIVNASLGILAARSADILPDSFGLSTSPARMGVLMAKWAELQARINADRAILANCRSGKNPCTAAARKFLNIIEAGRKRQGRARLGEINRAINLHVKPVSDRQQYDVEDYWASPLEMLTSHEGDCEDYAIAKYVALQAAGVAPDDLRLVIVRDVRHQATHAVVAARQDGEWLLLDNQTLVMVKANEVRSYLPLYVLDHGGVQAVATGQAKDQSVHAPGALLPPGS